MQLINTVSFYSIVMLLASASTGAPTECSSPYTCGRFQLDSSKNTEYPCHAVIFDPNGEDKCPGMESIGKNGAIQ